MKKHLFFYFLFLSAPVAFSQQDSAAATEIKPSVNQEIKIISERKPQKGGVGFTMNLIGFLDTISIGSFKDHIGNDFFLMRYYLQNNAALRLGLGLNLNNQKWSWVDSLGSPPAQVSRDSSYKRTDFYFSPGYEKHFLSGKNLDPYLAAALQIGKIGRTKITDKTLTVDTNGTSTIDINYNKEGGYLFGLNLIAGFNFFFSEKIALGAEYGFGVNTSRYGGDWNKSTVTKPANGTPSSKREVGSESVNSTKMKMNSMAGIMLSFYF